jgi:hypothetical protein
VTVFTGFRKRPPFLFPHRARFADLDCPPRGYVRAVQADGRPLWAPMYSWAPGPQTLAVPGDGSFDTLYGSAWMAQVCPDGSWRLYQRTTPETLTSRDWDVTPPVVSIDARHPSLAFDQAARPSLAWEDSDGVHIRFFDAVQNTYRFTTAIPGRDPALISDAQVTDPLDYPAEERDAYLKGIRVLLEWLPEPAWRDNVIPDSDVVLFYLSDDRERVLARAQRELFLQVHEIHDYAQPVVLDLATALHGHYQLHVSDQYGEPLPESLISDPYLGELIINPRAADGVTAAAAGEDWRAEQWFEKFLVTDEITAGVEPEALAATGTVYEEDAVDELVALVELEDAVVVTMFHTELATDELDALVSLEDVLVVTTTPKQVREDHVAAFAVPESIRVQAQ